MKKCLSLIVLQQKNWITTAGENINVVEKQIAEKIGRKQAIGLSAGTAALHLAIKLAGEKLYGQPKVGHGSLEGKKVFCSDIESQVLWGGDCARGNIPNDTDLFREYVDLVSFINGKKDFRRKQNVARKKLQKLK